MKAPESRVGDPKRDLGLIGAIVILVCGAQVVIVQPVIIQSLTEYQGYTPAHAGAILSAEMWGYALAAILSTLLTLRVQWRLLIRSALVLTIIGNFVSVIVNDTTIYTGIRFLTGFGAGFLVSFGFAMTGRFGNSDRSFGWAITGALVYGAVIIFLAPTLFLAFGFRWLPLLFMGCGLLAFFFTNDIQNPQNRTTVEVEIKRARLLPRILACAAMLIYFTAQGAIWSYLLLIGTNKGISDILGAAALSASQFFGIAGAFSVTFLALRFGRPALLVFGIGVGGVSTALLLMDQNFALFFSLVGIYSYAWNFTHPFLLGLFSSLDTSGSMVVNGVAMQKIGLAVGPGLAALLFGIGGYQAIVLASSALFVVSLLLVLGCLATKR
jgi:predicted MFS family arabinose efflux permease